MRSPAWWRLARAPRGSRRSTTSWWWCTAAHWGGDPWVRGACAAAAPGAADARRAEALCCAFMGAETRSTVLACTSDLVLHRDGHDVGSSRAPS